MPNTISIFNNKGGVGKTTYMYHVAHMLSRRGLSVLMVDCDSQCNLTAYCLSDAEVRKSWSISGNSIFQVIDLVYRGVGDIRQRMPTKIGTKGALHLIPGDLKLSNFEDLLGDTWSAARGGNEAALRAQSAIHRYIKWAADKTSADVILIDLGPNLGALNRSVLATSDYFITPVAPDLFSIQGTENLGNKLVAWRSEWDQCNAAWLAANGGASGALSIPTGRPTYLGYVVQMHNIRGATAQGMTAGWSIYGEQLDPAISANIVAKLDPLGQVVHWEDDNYRLGQIPNLHSLIPYSLEARKPVFDCVSSDGLRGAHLKRAIKSQDHFENVVSILETVATW